MLEAVDRRGRVVSRVGPHAEVGPRHGGLPGRRVVHRVVDAPVVGRQGLDVGLELLGVQPGVVVVDPRPGVAGDAACRDAGPGHVVGEAGMAVVLGVRLGRHVLHVLRREGEGGA